MISEAIAARTKRDLRLSVMNVVDGEPGGPSMGTRHEAWRTLVLVIERSTSTVSWIAIATRGRRIGMK